MTHASVTNPLLSRLECEWFGLACLDPVADYKAQTRNRRLAHIVHGLKLKLFDMNCMNCTENMVAKRKDKRYNTSSTSSSDNILRPLRPPTNQCSCDSSKIQVASLGASSLGKEPIISREMPFFCFDVLFSHVYRMEAPRWPTFTNDP